jgi:hypothetical protein
MGEGAATQASALGDLFGQRFRQRCGYALQRENDMGGPKALVMWFFRYWRRRREFRTRRDLDLRRKILDGCNFTDTIYHDGR